MLPLLFPYTPINNVLKDLAILSRFSNKVKKKIRISSLSSYSPAFAIISPDSSWAGGPFPLAWCLITGHRLRASMVNLFDRQIYLNLFHHSVACGASLKEENTRTVNERERERAPHCLAGVQEVRQEQNGASFQVRCCVRSRFPFFPTFFFLFVRLPFLCVCTVFVKLFLLQPFNPFYFPC